MAETKKYLDYEGLKTYHEKAKSEYDGKYALKGETGNVDLSNYIAKDTTVTDLDGNEVNAIDAIQSAYEMSNDLNDKYYAFDDTGDDSTPLVAKKIALWNFYNDNKDKDYALKSEVVDLDTLKQVVAEAPHIKKEKVETLPSEADGVENVLYLVPRSNTEDGNYFDQYLLIDGKWDPIGSTKTNLANYISKDEEVDFYEDGSLTVMDAIYEAYSEAKKAEEQFKSLEEQIYAGENNFYGQFLDLKNKVENASAEVESISNQEIDALFA